MALKRMLLIHAHSILYMLILYIIFAPFKRKEKGERKETLVISSPKCIIDHRHVSLVFETIIKSARYSEFSIVASKKSIRNRSVKPISRMTFLPDTPSAGFERSVSYGDVRRRRYGISSHRGAQAPAVVRSDPRCPALV